MKNPEVSLSYTLSFYIQRFLRSFAVYTVRVLYVCIQLFRASSKRSERASPSLSFYVEALWNLGKFQALLYVEKASKFFRFLTSIQKLFWTEKEFCGPFLYGLWESEF